MLTGVATYKLLDSTGLFLYHPIKAQCMALSMHLFTISTQVPDVPKALPYGTAVVLLPSREHGDVVLPNPPAAGLQEMLDYEIDRLKPE